MLALLVLSGLIGIWVDSVPVISVSTLHNLFLSISVLASIVILVCLFERVQTTSNRIISVLAAIVAWRISFFPIVVLAGCLTSWSNSLTNRFGAFDVVYPVFLVSFALLFATAIYVAVIVVRDRSKIAMTIAIGFGFIAAIVSFIAPTDFKWALTSNLTVDTRQPTQTNTPMSNPYPLILSAANLNWRQRLLMHIGSLTYQSLPTTGAPWAISVKGNLEQRIRAASNYKSETLLHDHYRGFSAAHVTIRRP